MLLFVDLGDKTKDFVLTKEVIWLKWEEESVKYKYFNPLSPPQKYFLL